MQAQRWRRLPWSSPFAGGWVWPAGDRLLECMEDIMAMGEFHEGISPGSLSGFLRHSHRYPQFIYCERFGREDRARVTGNTELTNDPIRLIQPGVPPALPGRP